MEMLIESELLLLITLRRRRKSRVWARQVYWESTIPVTATSVSLKWFSGLCIVTFLLLFGLFQKQPPRGAPRKRCSEKIRRTPMPKCDFNKVAKQPFRHGCSPVNLLDIFRTPFTKNTSERLLLLFSYIFEMLKKRKWYS